MFELDSRTLLIVIAMITIGAGIVLTFLWRVQERRVGLGLWAAGMSAISIACVLNYTRAVMPDYIGIVASNLLYIIGFLCLYRGTRVFTQRQPLWFFECAVLLLSVFVFYYFTYIQPYLTIRILTFSGVMTLISFAIIITLLTDNDKEQRVTCKPIAIIFMFFALLNFSRGVMEFFFPSQSVLTYNNGSESALYLSTIFIIGGLVITLILQTYMSLFSKLRVRSLAIERTASSIVIVNNEGIIEYANPAVLKKTGYTLDELVGQSAAIFRTSENAHNENKELLASLYEGKTWHGELHSQTKLGEQFWEIASFTPVTQPNGSVTHFIAVKEDITELKKAKQHIHHLANHDSLTGLPTRELFMERFQQAIQRAEMNSTKIAVLFLDLDGFKEVNDTFGHDAGDRLLQQATKHLSQCVRDNDTVARIGGDEFMILLTDINSKAMINKVIERMLKAVSTPFQIEGTVVHVSASIGISIYPDHHNDPQVLSKLSDEAMYKVKRHGKNNFGFHEVGSISTSVNASVS